MKFKTLYIENFMSIRKARIALDNQGLILVRGENEDSEEYRSNGAGKSTIFESLIYALFEKTIRGLSPNECVNETVNKNLRVTLDFIGDDGAEYRITRYRKDHDHKNNTYIFQNKKNITPKSNRDCNKLIEDIINIDFLTFTNSILFGQGVLKTFTMATDAEKKLILEKILKLDVWAKALDISKERIKNKKDELVQIENKIENKGNMISYGRNTIKSMREKSVYEKKRVHFEIDQIKSDIEEEKKKCHKQLKEMNNKLSLYTKQLNQFEENSDENKLKLINKNIKSVEDKLSSFDSIKNDMDQVRSDVMLKKRMWKQLGKEIKDLNRQKDEIESGVGTNCPVCGQEITKDSITESINHVNNEIKKKNKEFINTSDEYDLLCEKGKNLKKKLSDVKIVENKLSDLKDQASEIKASIHASRNKKEDLKENIKWIKDSIESIKEEKSIKRLIKMLKDKEESLDSNSYDELIEDKKNEINNLESEQEKLGLKREDERIKLGYLNFGVLAFGNSGIKSFILDAVTPYLNKRANYYLSKLAGGTTEIEFTTQTKLASGEYRDKFNVQIFNHAGGSSYKSNSTGERKRIDLAISLALQDLVMTRSNSNFNLLLYDECFDGLDDIGCENVMSLLQEMQKRIPSIFVITHNDTLKSFFEHTLLVTKNNGETSVQRVE